MSLQNNIKGFTLLELIGVMAVMAILSAVLVPSISDSIDHAYADAETINLDELAKSLIQNLKQNQQIPTATTSTWVNAIAAQSAFSTAQIEFNKKNYRRRIIFDPQFYTTSVTNFTGLTQDQGLASEPNSPRAIIISDLSQNVPTVTNSSTVFNDIWEQNSSATIQESKFIKIKRINFSPYFHRVILSNSNSNQPYYQLENGSTVAIPAENAGADGVLTRYITSSSQLNLFQDPFPAGNLTQTTIVNNDLSFRYELIGAQWGWVAQ